MVTHSLVKRQMISLIVTAYETTIVCCNFEVLSFRMHILAMNQKFLLRLDSSILCKDSWRKRNIQDDVETSML